VTRRTITYVIAYDISDPRRLARVHRVLREEAFPVQYSVFLATLDAATITRLLTRLGRLIDPGRDDVRAYPLPSAPEIESLGSGHVVEGLIPAPGQVLGIGRPPLQAG
jgi:CRISPR-associated protein Cas2